MLEDKLPAASASNPNDKEVIRRKTFASFVSSVGPGFWQFVYDKLLDDGLRKGTFTEEVVEDWSNPSVSDATMKLKVIPIRGYSGPPTCYPHKTLFSVDTTSFNGHSMTTSSKRYASKGKLVLVDSNENFRKLDKNAFIIKHLCPLEEAEKEPAQYNSFVLLCYPDLKNYSFTYWFGFPSISSVEVGYEPPVALKDLPFAEDFVKAYENGQELVHRNAGFFAYDLKEKVVKTIEQARDTSIGNIKYCFVDPSATPDVPGWSIKNYVASIVRQRSIGSGSKLQIISVRFEKSDLLARSCEFTIVPEFPKDWITNPKVLGWEKRDNKFSPKMVDLKSDLDPVALSKTTVDFNLKLMKWRLFPEFDLDQMHNLKICLLGAGTLGCNVARTLMGWGIRNISIVDNGKVSYSNPVRQSLYSYRDCGAPKAATAAKNLEAIFPGVQAKGYRLFIPMPGHPPITLGSTQQDFNTLQELVQASDVVFLLTDTRESRWLPTLLGVVHNKLMINAALGFDSYVVMRHGRQGEDLGCYFCTDIVVPGNSTVDRTLDQQCTVSRPGVSMIAGALAVELMTSVLYSTSSTSDQDSSSTLGAPAHSHRGFLSTGQYIAPTFQKFDKCSACSQNVVKKFTESGLDFVLQVMKDPKVLEEVAGLDQLAYGVDDIIELSDED